jgi:hypothetical protein
VPVDRFFLYPRGDVSNNDVSNNDILAIAKPRPDSNTGTDETIRAAIGADRELLNTIKNKLIYSCNHPLNMLLFYAGNLRKADVSAMGIESSFEKFFSFQPLRAYLSRLEKTKKKDLTVPELMAHIMHIFSNAKLYLQIFKPDDFRQMRPTDSAEVIIQNMLAADGITTPAKQLLSEQWNALLCELVIFVSGTIAISQAIEEHYHASGAEQYRLFSFGYYPVLKVVFADSLFGITSDKSWTPMGHQKQNEEDRKLLVQSSAAATSSLELSSRPGGHGRMFCQESPQPEMSAAGVAIDLTSTPSIS